MLEPAEAETLRDLGDGNLSKGIRESLSISQKAAKARKAKRSVKWSGH
jgi:hypothetical protein